LVFRVEDRWQDWRPNKDRWAHRVHRWGCSERKPKHRWQAKERLWQDNRLGWLRIGQTLV